MSRIPQPSSSSRSPSKAPLSPSKPLLAVRTRPPQPSSPSPSPRLRVSPSMKSLRSKSPSKPTSPLPAEVPSPTKPTLSIKEQIALKRAEAKKATAKSGAPSLDLDIESLEDAVPGPKNKQEDESIDLGRWTIKETIERARSTGAINLASRALPCLPSALFEIHLGVTPEPLKSAPQEPSIGSDDAATRPKGNHQGPSWYEAQDLEVLKAWSNEILEIQSEIFMFGSLKTVDLHNNKLTSLPDTFADLTALTSLDLSQNHLTSLPANLFALPNLTTLNLAHNTLTTLPFSAPFGPGSNPLSRTVDSRGDWFSQSITRATSPLPRLTILDVSYNKLHSTGFYHSLDSIPPLISKLDLSGNPLGESRSLIRALARLQRLHELRCEHADVGDESFTTDLFAAPTSPFPALKILDLGETHITRPAIEGSFTPAVIKQELEFEVTNDEPRDGTLRVILGKKVIKEAWEIETERKAKARMARHAGGEVEEGLSFGHRTNGRARAHQQVEKEAWEIEAEQGLLTEGARRRARAATASKSGQPSSPPRGHTAATPTSPQKKKPAVVEKEPWEIQAEQGMLTAGAQRRARAAAALAAEKSRSSPEAAQDTPSKSPSPVSAASILSNRQFFSASTQTLTLPSSTLPPKSAHARSFSMAMPSLRALPSSSSDLALAIPTPTLPLTAIAAQPFAHTLKVLILVNRRKDTCFNLPTNDDMHLPCLEELSLEGCNLPDVVPVSHGDSDDFSAHRSSESLLPLIAKLFPSLRTLDLSYNTISSAALTKDALSSLILANEAEARKGLRHLRLRGNRLSELDGFQGIADLFKGNRDVPQWSLEELDLRDNEIVKLPPELGLMPLDVFLVDGNTFRVPARRIWEREGTKGLLAWLRGRIE